MTNSNKNKNCFEKLFRGFVYVSPLVLFFSYYPIIELGRSGLMNFELSIPLIWLVLFDVIIFVLLCKSRTLLSGLRNKWIWILFPIWLTLSVIWSSNVVRGILTAGILWLVFFAGYGMLQLKRLLDNAFKIRWWKWFFGSAILICCWCFLQCFLDIFGVSRDYSLMCAGCTYQMFGFPHPNGFAIEPQFMGNLLLVPAIMSVWMLLSKRPLKSGFLWFCLFIISSTLFLTLSRGAIYAFVVGLVFLISFLAVKERGENKKILRKIGAVCGMIVFSFVITLNIQGIMAEISPTNDTYAMGVSKVLNQLSLGIIDLPVEKPVENFETIEEGANSDESDLERVDSVFDGYVVESTDTRLKLSNIAIEAYSREPKSVLFGVGLGGAGQTLYDYGLSPSPKEIVQNEYVSLLLETGLVGFVLFIMMIILVLRSIWQKPFAAVIFSMMVAFGVSLCFFAGLPNALHIYLLPVIIYMIYDIDLRKKLVE